MAKALVPNYDVTDIFLCTKYCTAGCDSCNYVTHERHVKYELFLPHTDIYWTHNISRFDLRNSKGGRDDRKGKRAAACRAVYLCWLAINMFL